jgi:hypothetical protein
MAKANKTDRDLLATLRDRYKKAVEADHDNRSDALDDLIGGWPCPMHRSP